MSVPLWSLLAFVAWTIGIVLLGIAAPRFAQVLQRRARPNEFRADVSHGSERYKRVMRAHANAVENLPLFTAIVLVAHVTGLQNATFDLLAAAVMPARVVQTVAHISSGSNRAVLIRATFFAVQVTCFVWMLALIALDATR